MHPLCCASDDLFRHVLQVGQGFAISVGSDGRKALIVALHLAVGTDHDRVIAELLIIAKRAFAHSRIVGLDGRAVVAKFGVKTSAGEDSAFVSDAMSDGQFQGSISRVGRGVNAAALRSWDEDKTVGAEQLGGEREVPLVNAGSGPERQVGGLLVAVGGFETESCMLRLALICRTKSGISAARMTTVRPMIDSAHAAPLSGGRPSVVNSRCHRTSTNEMA